MIRYLACLCLVVGTAVAETPTELADAAFKKGKELMAQKRFADACAAFDKSFEIEASNATLLNRADCREKNGQLATASKLFVDAEERTRGSSEVADQQMNSTAKTKTAALARRLSRLTIRVSGERSASFVLTVNDKPIDAKGWSAEPVDGGTYIVRAREAGFVEWTSKIDVAPDSDTRVIEVPKRAPVAVTVTQPEKPPPPMPPPPRSSRLRPLLLIGIGGVLGGGAFLAWRSGADYYSAAQIEGNDTTQTDLWESANKRRYIAQGLAAAGVVSIGVAVVLLVRGRERNPSKLSLVPTTNGIGLTRCW